MKKIDDIKSILENNIDKLKLFNVKKLILFGSYIDNNQTKNSDLDVIVEFHNNDSTHYLKLGLYLQNLLEIEIDLGELRDVDNDYLDQILKSNLIEMNI